MNLVSIVEGRGEPDAFRVLLPKVFDYLGYDQVIIKAILRAPGRGGLTRPGGVERYIELAVDRSADCILIALDADGDCPRTKAPAFGRRILSACPPVPVAFVCPKEMYESWLLASMDDISGKQLSGGSPSILRGIGYRGDPDNERNPKSWLRDAIKRSHPRRKKIYLETRDMKAMTEHLSVERTLQKSRSFRRLVSALKTLVGDTQNNTVSVTPV